MYTLPPRPDLLVPGPRPRKPTKVHPKAKGPSKKTFFSFGDKRNKQKCLATQRERERERERERQTDREGERES